MDTFIWGMIAGLLLCVAIIYSLERWVKAYGGSRIKFTITFGE